MQTIFAVIGWVFAGIVGLTVLVYVVLLIDAAANRWSMASGICYPLAKRPLISGGDRRVLVVYLPGILARGGDKPEILYRALAEGLAGTTSDLFTIDYAGEAFRWQQVVDEVATQIVLESRRSRDCGGYDAILIVGESLGGRLANAVVHQLNERGAGDKLVRPIIIDAPFDHRDFGAGGNVLAGILRIVPMGRLVNRLGLADRLFTQPAGLPQAENIANTGDLLELSCGNALTYEQYVAWVRLSARRGLSGHKFSVYRDQLVAMATMPWYDTFADVPPIYLACTDKDTPEWQTEYAQPVEAMLDGACPLERPANATVKQLQAAYRWMRAVPGATAWDVRIIRSTHCGYAERPLAWLDALADAVRDATTP